MTLLKLFVRDERGTETVEWGILAGVIVGLLVVAFAAIGTWMRTKLQSLQAEMEAN